jgi:hypothetical protein
MPPSKTRKPGRPVRSPIDPIRTAAWADAIWGHRLAYRPATIKGLGKAIACADPARQAARWYKYMRGITTPSKEIVQAVDKRLRGSAQLFDHPLWQLAESQSLAPWELRSLVLRMGEFAGRVADPRVLTESTSPFWRVADFDHREVISSVLDACAQERGGWLQYLGLAATLVVLIHDAEHAQRQVQHFEAHVGLVRHLQLVRQKGLLSADCVGKVEAILVERWLSTQYRQPRLRELMKHLASIDHSSVHRRGAAKDLSEAALQRLKSLRGQWVIEEIARRPSRLGLPPGE